MKYQLINDILNIVGIVPYSHLDGNSLDEECTYEDSIEESTQGSICEFNRPLGGFELIFPLKDNIKYYMNFFKEISPNNKALWEEIEKKLKKKNNNSMNIKMDIL